MCLDAQSLQDKNSLEDLLSQNPDTAYDTAYGRGINMTSKKASPSPLGGGHHLQNSVI
jgi:hypothetical protein